ncbi:MAG: hypothetical protein GKR93_04315 [Gammaproteobacteria bacterium]|nr:hypothetical protein [Gammaproteobacteria bacterium]
MNRQAFLTVGVCVLMLTNVWAADQFGRFFTSPTERQRLDELRNGESGPNVQVEEVLIIEEIEEEIEEEKEPLSVDTLTVRGLVYRGEGKNTAWINNSNTFEGGLSSQYINIGDIESSNVEIKIPSAEKQVKLGVGESFDPASEQYDDLVDAEISKGE